MNACQPPCDCCEGLTRQTPRPVYNRAGLAQIGYRVGTHATFRASLLAALSDAAFPELAALTTRADDDFTIALLDAWAVWADILTFYQERLANESYLRTATQQRSVFELARLVGYRPSPGVAAAAPLAFMLTDAPGAPATALIPAGTRVQSVPAPGQTPQTFETGTDLTARVAHNALPAVSALPVDWAGITTALWLDGTATGLRVGDALLLVDAARLSDSASELWEIRVLSGVQTDAPGKRTLVSWSAPLPNSFRAHAGTVSAYALRKRAALFGASAPDPNMLSGSVKNYPFPAGGADWSFSHPYGAIDLDAPCPEVTPASADGSPSWLVLGRGSYRELYAIHAARDVTPLKYTLSGRTTRLTLDRNDQLDAFVDATRRAIVFLQSEPLALAAQPLTTWSPAVDVTRMAGLLAPVEGTALLIEGGTALQPAQTIGVSGRRLRLAVLATGASFQPADGQPAIASQPGDAYLIDAFPPAITSDGALAWSVLTPSGDAGTLTGNASAVQFAAAASADPTASEAARVGTLEKSGAITRIGLAAPLARIYDRASVRVNANVVEATHGETVQEILGSGDSSRPNQSFALKQGPLTYTSTVGGDGAESTLQIWVNDLRWQERETLLGSGAAERVFRTARGGQGDVSVTFGDGVNGARPPTGQMNLRATYRKGIGRAGNLPAGQLSQALDRPAGLQSVSNPAPATGGADPAGADDARLSAPLHVRTLDRIVSLADYQDTARNFAGIAKALATWTWFGETRGVVISVAGASGMPLDPAGETIANLLATCRDNGNPYVPVRVLPYQPRLFRLAAELRIDTTQYDPDKVTGSVCAALSAAFGFDARDLGAGLARSAVIAAIHTIPGVQAVRLTAFRRSDQPATLPLPDLLLAAAPRAGSRGAIAGAELLTIDPATLSEIGAVS
jgi:hypothetical protein